MQLPTEWPSKARVIAQATELGIGAARAHDLDGFGEAVKSLELHPEARDVHAHMIRELVETQYQDGVSGDDLSEVLTRTARDAGAWNAPVDPSAVVVVLTGSLAVVQRSDDDGPATDIPPARLNGAAVLVIADLAAVAALDHRPYLMRAVEEIRRAQTVEMP
ncbi:hypothetical protein [Gordonia insulae]|nr:hypothetical protein [Gordonia insulae]